MGGQIITDNKKALARGLELPTQARWKRMRQFFSISLPRENRSPRDPRHTSCEGHSWITRGNLHPAVFTRCYKFQADLKQNRSLTRCLRVVIGIFFLFSSYRRRYDGRRVVYQRYTQNQEARCYFEQF